MVGGGGGEGGLHQKIQRFTREKFNIIGGGEFIGNSKSPKLKRVSITEKELIIFILRGPIIIFLSTKYGKKCHYITNVD